MSVQTIKSSRRRVLILNRWAPWQLCTGERIRNHWLLHALATHYRIDLRLAQALPEIPSEYTQMLQSIESFPSPSGLAGLLQSCGDVLIRRRPVHAAGVVSPALRAEVARLLSEHEYAAIQADLSMADAIPAETSVPIVYTAHNCETVLQRRLAYGERFPLAAVMRWDARRLARFEQRFVRRAALVAACSFEDIAAFDQLSRTTPISTVLVPNGVSLSKYAGLTTQTTAPPTVLISGNMESRANQQGLLWFLHDVLPLLRARKRDVVVRIAGRIHASFSDMISHYEGVLLVPNPPDMRPELERAQLVLVPVTASSGARIRILEAWAAGRPVVTTTAGVHGIEHEEGHDLIVRDDPLEFVDAICGLLNTPGYCDLLRRHGLERVAQYDWSLAGKKLVEAYWSITEAPDALVAPSAR